MRHDELARVLHHLLRRREEVRLAHGPRLHVHGQLLVGLLVRRQVLLVQALEVRERKRQPLLHAEELRVALDAEDVALVASRGFLLQPRRELDGRLRERLVGLREALSLRVVADLAHHLDHVASQVRGEPGHVARRDLGHRLREGGREVLADVPHLGQRGLFLVGEALGSLLEGSVVAVDVDADVEEVIVELRPLARRVHVDEKEEGSLHPALELGEVERLVVREPAPVHLREVVGGLLKAGDACGDRVPGDRRDLAVVRVQAELARVRRVACQELVEDLIAERAEGARAVRAGRRPRGGGVGRRRDGQDERRGDRRGAAAASEDGEDGERQELRKGA